MKYFKPEEFLCRCGCGDMKMDQSFVEMLDAAREKAGIPFVISSGKRCPKHNKEVNSTSTNHTLGVASDIRCIDGPSRFKIIKALIEVGFSRIGVAKTFIHCDTNTLPSSIWFY
jgi:uncharacterized protein YcbK (DUF882 family)